MNTRNEIHVSFSGDCHSNKDAIKHGFHVTLTKLLEDSKQCGDDVVCAITDVDVMCGSRVRRAVRDDDVTFSNSTSELQVSNRSMSIQMFTSTTESALNVSESNDTESPQPTAESTDNSLSTSFETEFRLLFTITGRIVNTSDDVITEQDQLTLGYSVDDVYMHIADEVAANNVSFLVNDDDVIAVGLDTLQYTTVVNECSAGEVYEPKNEDRTSARCGKSVRISFLQGWIKSYSW